jgi:hypothetical protein
MAGNFLYIKPEIKYLHLNLSQLCLIHRSFRRSAQSLGTSGLVAIIVSFLDKRVALGAVDHVSVVFEERSLPCWNNEAKGAADGLCIVPFKVSLPQQLFVLLASLVVVILLDLFNLIFVPLLHVNDDSSVKQAAEQAEVERLLLSRKLAHRFIKHHQRAIVL